MFTMILPLEPQKSLLATQIHKNYPFIGFGQPFPIEEKKHPLHSHFFPLKQQSTMAPHSAQPSHSANVLTPFSRITGIYFLG